ncbi:glycosyltransferase [Micromonospora sp. NPDC049523]|uniref:glycosyltransferase n=1 Tax=Micromonospora sp. NPDC049523 TaxID=3155921 RepID=UPI00342931CA
MRFLFSFAGGSGHFIPLVPIARAAEAAGHQVAFACTPGMAATVEAAGFTAVVSEAAPAGAPRATPTAPPERIPLRPIDYAQIDREIHDIFAGRAARQRAARMLDICPTWQPDLVVCDEADFGSMVAAERLGLPYASVLVLAAGSLIRPDLVAEPLNGLRAAYDLPPDPELAMLSRYLVFSPAPPSYRDPAFPLPATAHSIRPVTPTPPVVPATAPWVGRTDDRPGVYLTLGTEFPIESGDLFPRLIAGLGKLDVNLLVTVGQQIDPAEFGRQPEHVRIERFVPQALVLPRSDLVVSHAGSGSVIGALEHGLPMVLAPMGADQPANAARCAELGVGRVLDAFSVTPEAAAAAVSTVLTDDGYRQAAVRLRDEIAALPGPEHAVPLMERLAVERQPVLAAG